MFNVSEPFCPRTTKFREVIDFNEFRFKTYQIQLNPSSFDWQIYQQAIKQFASDLPNPAITKARPGVGFIICHQGREWHYLVICYWDNENELVQKVFIRKFDDAEKWSPASGGQSICVWDIEVIWFERNAYVEKVLSNPASPDLEGYLKTHFNNTLKL